MSPPQSSTRWFWKPSIAEEHYQTALRLARELPTEAIAMYRRIGMPKHVEMAEALLGEPRALVLGRERLAVAAVQDRWRIDDEWWRTRPVSRLYYSLLLEDGRTVTV